MDTCHHSLHTFPEIILRQIHRWCFWSWLQVTDTVKERKHSLCLPVCGDTVELESVVVFYDEHHVTQIHWKRISRLRFHIWKLTALVKLGTWIIMGVNRNYSKFLWQKIGAKHENGEFWRPGATVEWRESTMRVVYNSSVYKSLVTQKLIDTVPGTILG